MNSDYLRKIQKTIVVWLETQSNYGVGGNLKLQIHEENNNFFSGRYEKIFNVYLEEKTDNIQRAIKNLRFLLINKKLAFG